MIVVTIQAIIAISYLLFLYNRFGEVPSSISDSYYRLPIRLKGLFTLFCWSLGSAMMLHGGYLFFISGLGLCLAGMSTRYNKYTINALLHYVGAMLAIVGGFLSLIYYFDLIQYPIIFAYVSAVHYLYDRKNIIWWVEVHAIVLLITGITHSYLL